MLIEEKTDRQTEKEGEAMRNNHIDIDTEKKMRKERESERDRHIDR